MHDYDANEALHLYCKIHIPWVVLANMAIKHTKVSN